MSPVHIVVPDTQSKPGAPNDHLRWVGKYILDRKPDVVVHLGDHWDMPSLSSYDRGKASMEGRRYEQDIIKGNEDLALLTAPTNRHNNSRRIRPLKPYNPRLVLLRGNHEYRIIRAAEESPHLVGKLSYDDLESPGWEVHDFLKPCWIDNIAYSHFFSHPMTGKPYGGMISTRLKTIGHSFTMGHVQGLDHATRYIGGPNGPQQQRGLQAGSCYPWAETYKGYQGNAHWRGVLVKHDVRDGAYDLMEVSLDFLARKYEGADDLDHYMSETYGPGWEKVA